MVEPTQQTAVVSTLKYLGLPEDYQPSPVRDPVEFLTRHLRVLPPQLLQAFSSLTTAKQRTAIPVIRNRRLMYIQSQPSELRFDAARIKWPTIWQGREPLGAMEDEKLWVNNEFLGGQKLHVGKLGTLLGDQEEEREAQRIRKLRRQAAEEDFIPEEDSESDESDDEPPGSKAMDDFPEDLRADFERIIRERLVYGLLDVRYN